MITGFAQHTSSRGRRSVSVPGHYCLSISLPFIFAIQGKDLAVIRCSLLRVVAKLQLPVTTKFHSSDSREMLCNGALLHSSPKKTGRPLWLLTRVTGVRDVFHLQCNNASNGVPLDAPATFQISALAISAMGPFFKGPNWLKLRIDDIRNKLTN